MSIVPALRRSGALTLAVSAGLAGLGLVGVTTASAAECTAGPGTSTQTGTDCRASTTGERNQARAGAQDGRATATATGSDNTVQAIGVAGGRGSASASGIGNDVQAVGFLGGQARAGAVGLGNDVLAQGIFGGRTSARARGVESRAGALAAGRAIARADATGTGSSATAQSSEPPESGRRQVALASARDGGDASAANGSVSCAGRSRAVDRVSGLACVGNGTRVVYRTPAGRVIVSNGTPSPVGGGGDGTPPIFFPGPFFPGLPG